MSTKPVEGGLFWHSLRLEDLSLWWTLTRDYLKRDGTLSRLPGALNSGRSNLPEELQRQKP